MNLLRHPKMQRSLRFLGSLLLVGVSLVVLVQLLARLTWFLAGNTRVDMEALQQIETAMNRGMSEIGKVGRGSTGRELRVNGPETPDPQTRNAQSATRNTQHAAYPVHAVAEWPLDQGRNFHEAPMLQKRVQAGELPPVSERLPEDPLVVIPPDQNGPYGGNWARFATGPSDIGIFRARLAYDGLVRWNATGTEVLPNLASRWEITDGGRTYTFWLRRGVYWSDGEPFTVDDILFWYEHELLNKELMPVVAQEFQRDGEVMAVEKIDDNTVRFRFVSPYGLFLQALASGRGYEIVESPEHYLKRFHADFTPREQLEAMAREAGFDLWYQLYEDKSDWRNPEIPRLWPWIVVRPPPAQPCLFERNPYYWKVDPDGNQLPYIDTMTFEIYDPETINLKAINGEIGMQGRHLQFSNYPLFMQNSKVRGYRVFHWIGSGGANSALAINLNHKDPVLKQIFHDRRFRIALSHAINREELNEIGFFGVGEPRQMAPPPSSLFYSPEYEKAYIEHDPTKANALLDEMGLTQRTRDGTRRRPDGKPLKISIEMASVFLSTPVFEMIAGYWTDVGVKTELKLEARQLFYTRKAALMHDVGVWGAADELLPVMDPRWFFPYTAESIQGIDYARWFQTNGRQGEEPPPRIRRCMDLYRQIERTPDEAEQIRLFHEILELNRENLWVIGTIGNLPAIFLVKDTFHNVPHRAVSGWVFRTPGNTAPECYAVETGGRGE